MTIERALNILLIDGEEIIHKTVSSYLSDLGHRVTKVGDISSALEAAEERNYDLAFVDTQKILRMDVLHFLARIHEVRPEMSVVIIIEGENMDLAIQALKLGAADFLTKPLKLLKLDAALEKAVRLRKLITQHAQMQMASRNCDKYYRLFAESMVDFICVTDEGLRCLYVSPAVKQTLGYDVEETTALIWEEILSPSSIKTVKEAFAEKAAMVEIGLIHKDASVVLTKAKLALLHDSDGQPIGILEIIRNDVEHRKTEEP